MTATMSSTARALDSRALLQALTATEAETEAGGRRLLSAASPLACTTKAIIIFCLCVCIRICIHIGTRSLGPQGPRLLAADPSVLLTSSFRPYDPHNKILKLKSFQEITKSGSQKYCQKLWRYPVDHV